MASYTIELGTILRMVHATPEDNWRAGWDTIGLSCYPIYDEEHRAALNGRLIRHYFLREIGVETPEMFAYYMDEAMRLIMPAYNKMYESELMSVARLLGANVEVVARDLRDLTRNDKNASSRTRGLDTTLEIADAGHAEGTSTTDTTVTSEQSGTTSSKRDGTESGTEDTTTRNLDTPQNDIGLMDDGYLTEATIVNGETSKTTSETGSDTSSEEASGTTKAASSQTSDTTASRDSKGTESEEATTDETRDRKEQESYDREREERRTDPRYYELLLGTTRKILDIDRLVIEDNEVRSCFMSIF